MNGGLFWEGLLRSCLVTILLKAKKWKHSFKCSCHLQVEKFSFKPEPVFHVILIDTLEFTTLQGNAPWSNWEERKIYFFLLWGRERHLWWGNLEGRNFSKVHMKLKIWTMIPFKLSLPTWPLEIPPKIQVLKSENCWTRSYVRSFLRSNISWNINFRRDFPGGPVVKTALLLQGGMGSISGWGTKIPRAVWPKKKIN